MSISSLGVGSGLDLESLVRNMVSVQRDTRVASYNERINDYKSEVSAYGAIRSAMEKFETSVKDLNDISLFNGRSANMTQPSSGDIVSVEADSDASNGSYNISVEQLSQGSRSVSTAGSFTSGDDVVSASGGDLTFTAGSETFTINVAAGTTLSELREQINDSADNFGVSANLIDDGTGNNVYLSMTSSVSGQGNDLVVENTDASLDSVSSVAFGGGAGGMSITAGDEARDAIINVDGIDIRSDTNSFDGAVSGLSIKALAVSNLDANGEPEKARAAIDFDKEKVKETLEGFTESYNALLSVFDRQTSTQSVLNGSSLVRSLEGALNSNLMTTFSDAGALGSIFDVGIKMDDDGKLSLDSTRFNKAMEQSYDDVATLFAGDNGISKKLEELVSTYTGSDGLLKDLVDASNSSASGVEDQLENYEYRMELYEQQLRDRFTQLDTTLASMNSNGNYLMAQLSNLSSNNN